MQTLQRLVQQWPARDVRVAGHRGRARRAPLAPRARAVSRRAGLPRRLRQRARSPIPPRAFRTRDRRPRSLPMHPLPVLPRHPQPRAALLLGYSRQGSEAGARRRVGRRRRDQATSGMDHVSFRETRVSRERRSPAMRSRARPARPALPSPAMPELPARPAEADAALGPGPEALRAREGWSPCLPSPILPRAALLRVQALQRRSSAKDDLSPERQAAEFLASS